MAARIPQGARGAIVVGAAGEEVAEPVTRLAAACGWPILADALSGLRRGPHERSHVVAHYDVLLRSEEFAAAHRPELVMRVGDTPTSKPLRAWLGGLAAAAARPARRLARADAGRRDDRAGGARAALQRAGRPRSRPPPSGPYRTGSRRGARRTTCVPPALEATPEPFEPRIYTAFADAAPDGAILWVASSMPVRDVESFLAAGDRRLRVLANRGANGIDGTVSSALGAAIGSGLPVLPGDRARWRCCTTSAASRRCAGRACRSRSSA